MEARTEIEILEAERSRKELLRVRAECHTELYRVCRARYLKKRHVYKGLKRALGRSILHFSELSYDECLAALGVLMDAKSAMRGLALGRRPRRRPRLCCDPPD